MHPASTPAPQSATPATQPVGYAPQPAAPAAPAPARDPYLWQLARCRAKFQAHLLVYLVVNAGLWALYLLLPATPGGHLGRELPWPVWTSLFWGFGLLSQGLRAYSGLSRGQLAQREYERLLGRPAL